MRNRQVIAALIAVAGISAALSAQGRSTARGRPSPTRSTRSGSASTTSCTRRCRSTISRSARGRASAQLTSGTVFFGATDGPMTDEQLLRRAREDPALPDRARRRRAGLQHSRRRQELKFTGPLLADIFLGKITKWNDPAIAELNAGVSLPATEIAVVHRSDGSGTTYIWVDYLVEGRRRSGRRRSA